MTGERHQAEEEQAVPEGDADDRRHIQPDWFLCSLVSFVNSVEITLSITLTVGGTLVTGQLVGGKHYFEAFSTDFCDALGRPEEDGLRATIGKPAERYDALAPGDTPTYIHLRDATIFASGAGRVPQNRPVWWRGRLSSVDGFILGELS